MFVPTGPAGPLACVASPKTFRAAGSAVRRQVKGGGLDVKEPMNNKGSHKECAVKEDHGLT